MTSGTVVTLAPAPAGPDELAGTARDCQAVGATVLLLPPLGVAAAGAVLAAVREETDLLVQAADPGLGADLVTVPLGTPGPLLADLVAAVGSGGGTPVYEVSAPEHLDVLADLLDRTGPPAPVLVSLVLGSPGGLPGTLVAVADCLRRLPAGAVWSAAGRGATALPVLLAALSAGGHVRAGAADGSGTVPGDPGRADLQLVARAAGLARIAQRPPVPPAAARDLLLGPAPGLLAPRTAPSPTSVEIR
ncbi:3-keto-5-aminohexanoate cleavage protein [Blastococcus sp. URHD0036]|uniref:3-keto-5-aminohexanoate cleavage protein n=1 Tax=Blastococcus sp. URHD0036 TaxID=1380356 RepID=UPI00068E88B0|nr:3-keto-5-aminohexanoate cleavage protein [Blastococcus sp. URHD0036]